jgi:hypothetical protein
LEKNIVVVNLKIIIPIIIVIIIAGVIAFNSEQETSKEEIQWRTSGVFQIEKYEYYLGEKIFINLNDIPTQLSGEITFFRPELDRTNKKIKEIEGLPAELISKKIKYLSIKFDGENKQSFNRYFEPKFSEWNGVCSRSDLVGEWLIVFSGTPYKNMNFVILNQTMSGDTRLFEPIC